MLKALKTIYNQHPDEIIVSTPGPIGIIGIICSRLLHIPCKGIYHTDFSAYARKILDDELIARTTQEAVRVFYSFCTQILVPTHEYKSILTSRGYDPQKMSIFKRAVDNIQFAPRPHARDQIMKQYGISQGLSLLYTGRISKEKNIDSILTLYKNIIKTYTDTHLILVGDGPDFEHYRDSMIDYNHVHFLGRLPRKMLPDLYSSADLFLFPSVTDTFGMSVLEAQACGLPAIVTTLGGPKEIVMHNITGYVVDIHPPTLWESKIIDHFKMINNFPEKYLEMKYKARNMVLKNYTWSQAINNLFTQYYTNAKKRDTRIIRTIDSEEGITV